MLFFVDAAVLIYFKMLVVKSTASVVLMTVISTALLASVIDVSVSLIVSAVVVCAVAYSDQEGTP